MSYGMPYKNRRPAKQTWAVGEQVKVGFLSLRCVQQIGSSWILLNKDGTKRYEFTPHMGLVAL